VSTIGSAFLPYPHIQTTDFNNENLYYTVAYQNDKKICSFDGFLNSQFELPPLTGFNRNIFDRLLRLESKLDQQKYKESNVSAETLALYCLLKSTNLQKIGSMLFGMSNNIIFSEFDVCKDFKVEGKHLTDKLKLLYNGKKSDLIFTMEIDGISKYCNFEMFLYLNKDSNTSVNINFTSKCIELNYRQSDSSNYTEFSGNVLNVSKCDLAQFIQFRYDTKKEKFTEILTCKDLGELNPIVYGDISIDKKFVYDWIGSKSRRIQIKRLTNYTSDIELKGFTVTVV